MTRQDDKLFSKLLHFIFLLSVRWSCILLILQLLEYINTEGKSYNIGGGRDAPPHQLLRGSLAPLLLFPLVYKPILLEIIPVNTNVYVFMHNDVLHSTKSFQIYQVNLRKASQTLTRYEQTCSSWLHMRIHAQLLHEKPKKCSKESTLHLGHSFEAMASHACMAHHAVLPHTHAKPEKESTLAEQSLGV